MLFIVGWENVGGCAVAGLKYEDLSVSAVILMAGGIESCHHPEGRGKGELESMKT